MDTIFDHNPTDQELKDLFSFDKSDNTMCYGFSVVSLPLSEYSLSPKKGQQLDLAILFEARGEQAKADAIWSEIPDIERQYRAGFDYVVTPL